MLVSIKPKLSTESCALIPLEKALEILNSNLKLPIFSSTVAAGFPSPADDYLEYKLSLDEHIIKHPAATFFVRASGDSMQNAGIYSGDLLVVDRSLTATHNSIVIAAINGEFTVKRLIIAHGIKRLVAENPQYPALEIKEEQDVIIWGVVTCVVHQFT